MAPFKSSIPDVPIPVTDTYSFIFESKLPATLPPRRDQIALIDAATDQRVTYGELVHRIHRFAAGVRYKLGLNKWEVVGVFSPNQVDYPTVVFGALKAGCTVTLANPTYTADELAYQLTDAGAKILITCAPLLPVATAAAAKAGIAADKIFIFGREQVQGKKTIYDIFSCEYLAPIQFTKEELLNKPAYLCYSSGTTGRSKGVETTHYNMVANVAQLDAYYVHSNQYRPNDVWTGVLPFYHIYGLNLSLHTCFYAGISLVVFQKFDLVAYLEALQKYRVTYTHIVPPIILGLAKHPIVDKYDLSSLRMILSGAAPLSGDVSRAASARLKCSVLQGYGMTESSPVTHVGVEGKTPDGAIGVLVPNVEARLVDPDTGEDCAVNQPGELWVRGPNIMKGYHNNDEATRNTIDAEGWLHTGDIAYADKNGFFFIVDRLKELIKYKGFQVPPAELEGYLLTHPAIADAAVISRPDESAGELPRAYVVLKPGAKATEQEVQKFIEGKVAQHKRLRGGVAFVDEIPKAASGKILRRVLRDMDKEAMKREAAAGKAKL
ncbi:uncharacterized protein SPPG_07106 [Spizellomyces punctatus DAOM BR117]|uniref:4-coumarate-CoA ligase n=1 Tax=Spizellomyces punctatus (strain DAOM BR117) TaxID=645134 RepID=A0A0L0H8X6_SPIPD|nr:uncharacterized protein SPPG_07106 [Spizellomyces punctatus DAOM BR117]KNC97637.1 hypothetical protein SPPG_07106 [Spizellomyces punctatus DAOM BR117]|eukprot:XP_016605677.1 hypothetical protein SPPG_07106 [Spizellomyces punctatus DAOM BR117]